MDLVVAAVDAVAIGLFDDSLEFLLIAAGFNLDPLECRLDSPRLKMRLNVSLAARRRSEISMVNVEHSKWKMERGRMANAIRNVLGEEGTGDTY